MRSALTILSMLIPLSAVAQPRILVCQGDYKSINNIVVYNFTTASIPAIPPIPVPTSIPYQVIPVSPTRTPVPTQYQSNCVDNETTTFLDVPSDIDPPGAPRNLAAWSYSHWGVRSGRSNILTGNVLPMAKPVLLR